MSRADNGGGEVHEHVGPTTVINASASDGNGALAIEVTPTRFGANAVVCLHAVGAELSPHEAHEVARVLIAAARCAATELCLEAAS